MRIAIKWLMVFAGLFMLALTGLWFSSPIDPASWLPAPNAGLRGEFSPNTRLSGARLLLNGVGVGPEDVTVGPDGLMYTGFEDGRIVRFDRDGAWTVYADTEGRPLGMQFNDEGDLIVVDALRGLISVKADGSVSVLADSVNGEKIGFADDLDIATDGTVWFSDASMRHGYGDDVLDLLEARPTGRLLRYSPQTGEVTVHLDNLWFANGVALGPDEDYVLVAETFSGLIHRLWLKGEVAGHFDVFHSGLPGFPDNLSFNGKDRFWVAIPGLRTSGVEALSGQPFIRKVLAALPRKLLNPTERYGFVIALDLNGNVVANLQAPQGRLHSITSVNQVGNSLLLGSYIMQSVAILELQ